jgi:hypothetical protein
MYYSGLDPLKMEPVYTAQGLREKRLQKALLLYWNPEHWPLAREALKLAGREDLIGRGPHALVPPETPAEAARRQRAERDGREASEDGPRYVPHPKPRPSPRAGERTGPRRPGTR